MIPAVQKKSYKKYRKVVSICLVLENLLFGESVDVLIMKIWEILTPKISGLFW
jgi:hypothetical protein